MKNRRNPLSLYALLAIAGCLVQQSASAQLQAKFSANATAGCAPLVVQFNDQSAGNPGSWQWDLGNGTISLFQHPSTVYFLPGTYPVKLVIKNAGGADSVVKQDFITVYANPVADFKATDSVGCFPFKINFTDKSAATGATINKWQWDFGDGNTSTLQNPQHTYLNSGNYTVTLKIVTDKGCTQTFSKEQYIKINSGVKTQFSDSGDKNCKAPSTSFFTSSSTGPGVLSYSWNFGDGVTSSAPNPSHTYNTNGTYTVSLITTSNAGCSDTLRKTVKLGTTITQFAVPDSICYGEIIPVTNTSSPAPATALWNFGDGTTSTALNPQKAYFTPGTFNIRLVNTYEKCIDSITKAVKVFSKPTASFTSDVQTFCGIPATVKFSAGNSGIAYRWEFGDGTTANTRDAAHTYNAFGNYTVKLFVTGAGGCIDSVVKKDYIKIARAQVRIPVLPARGCVGLSVPFVAKPVGTNITNLHWDFGDGTTSTETAPIKTYNVEGTYTVKLFFTTQVGCQDSVVVRDSVRVSKKPVVSFVASPTESCGANKIMFENTSSPAGTQWLWEFGDKGTSSQQNFFYQYRDTGYFDVKLAVWNNECVDSLVKKRYIHFEAPIARLHITRNCDDKNLLTFENFSIDAKTWLWEFGDGTTSTEYSPSHRYAKRGFYTVKLKVWNKSCGDSAAAALIVANENLQISTNATDACKGTNLQFKALNYDARYISTLSWDFGDGQTQNQKPDVSHKYSKPGNYKVTLHYTDINGCSYTTAMDQPVHIFGPTALLAAAQQTKP